MTEPVLVDAGIYILRNSLTGRVYVGQSGELSKREQWHFYALRCGKHTNPHLQYSASKYGLNNFEFATALKGRKRPPEVGQKISSFRKGRPLSAETKAKMSKAQKKRFARERGELT